MYFYNNSVSHYTISFKQNEYLVIASVKSVKKYSFSNAITARKNRFLIMFSIWGEDKKDSLMAHLNT